MTPTPIDKVYKKFLSFIGRDFEFASLDDVGAKEVLDELLDTVIALHFSDCYQDITETDISSGEFPVELTRTEVSIIAYSMVLPWIEPKILTDENIIAQMGSRDVQATSIQAHLNTLMKLEKRTQSKLKSYREKYMYEDFEGFN